MRRECNAGALACNPIPQSPGGMFLSVPRKLGGAFSSAMRRFLEKSRRTLVSPWTARLALVILAGVFLWAGVAKLVHRVDFFNAIAHYKLLPLNAAYRMSIAVPYAEIAIGSLLLVPVVFVRRTALIAYLTLLALFTGSLVLLWFRGEHTNCGCFGGTGQGHPALSILRNLLLISLCLLGWRARWGRVKDSAPGKSVPAHG